MQIGDPVTASDYLAFEQVCAFYENNTLIGNAWKCDQNIDPNLDQTFARVCPGGSIPAARGVQYKILGSFGLFGAPGDHQDFLDPLDYFFHPEDQPFLDWEFREPRGDGIQSLTANPFAIAGIFESPFFPLFITPSSQTVILNEAVGIQSPTPVIRWVLSPDNVGKVIFSDATSLTYQAPPSITQSQTITVSACDATRFHPDNCGQATLELTPVSVTILTPSQTEILPPNKVQLTAQVNPSSAAQNITWEVTAGGEAGTVDPATGLFQAKLFNQSTKVTVKATSTVADPTKYDTIELSVPVPTITIHIPDINNPWYIPTNGIGITPAHIEAFVSGVTDSRNTELPLWMSGIPANPFGGIGTFVNILGGPPCIETAPCSADYEVNLPPPTTASAQVITLCNITEVGELANAVCGTSSFSYVPQSSVSPQAANLNPSGQQQFTSIPGVTWSICSNNLGTITQTGLYTAPPPPNDFQQTVGVCACFNTNPNSCGKATVTLLPSPDFTLSSAPLTATPGGTVSFTVTVTPLNGFTGTVNIANCPVTPPTSTITVTGCPTSVNITSGAATFSVTTATTTSTPLQNYTVGISATSPSLSFSKTANLNLDVEDFTIGATPSSVTTSGGGTATYTVTTAASGSNGFTLPVCLGVSGQPGGVTPTLKPSCIQGVGSSTLTLPIANNTQAGNYSLTITGTSTTGGGTDAHTVSPNPALTVTPTIGSLSVSSGVVGTSVTITGTNFGSAQNGSTLTFGGVPATNITTWNDTSIVAVVPVGTPAGSDPVLVTVNNIPSNTVNITIFPSITALSVTSGPINTPLTLTGNSFGSTQGQSTVTFNGISAGNAVTWSDTAVTVAVPAALTPGVYSVVVTVNGTASNPPGVTAPTFTVVPSITSLSLTQAASGTPVTITGTNFGSSQGSSTVTFNGTAGTPSTWSNNSITVPVPTGLQPGPGSVVVTNVFPSNAAAFAVAPGITGINPGFGAVGSSVSIQGTSFGTIQGNGTVTFNGTAATVTNWANATLTVTVPSGASSGNVVVTAGGVASGGTPFAVTSPTTYFLTSTASAVSGLMTLGTTNGGTTSLNSADLNNQPTGEYLIQAFDTAVGVPGAASTWPAGLAATFTVWMKQTTGTTGNLFPDLKLYLNSLSGTPICSVMGTTALTTTNTQYSLNCAPATNIARAATDQYYLWVGVNSTQAATSSTQATVGLGIQLRGRPASSVTVPIQ
jgi:hypothetical protein